MHKLSERGVVHLLVPLILLLGIIGGVFLVTQGDPLKLFSKAAPTLPSAPEASFELELEKSGEPPFPDEATPATIPIGSKFRVDVYARSDIEASNLFKANIHFTRDTDRIFFIQPLEINRREGQSFVKNWVETASSGITFITMTGGVANPGIQTDAKSGALLMGSIVFEAKRLGKVKIELTDDSAIYSNANNINILTAKKGAIEVEITDIKPSPTPTPMPHNASCTGVLVEGGIQGKLPDGSIVYTVESEGKLKLTAQVNPTEGSTAAWVVVDRPTGYPSLPNNGGSFEYPVPNYLTVNYTAPKNSKATNDNLNIEATTSTKFSDNFTASTKCPLVGVSVKPVLQPSPSPTPLPSGTGVGISPGKIIVPQPLAPGSIYEYPSLSVWNTGTLEGDYILSINYITGQQELKPPATWFTFTPQQLHLLPNQGQAVTMKLTVPTQVQPGNYFVLLMASVAVKGVPVNVAAATKLYFTVSNTPTPSPSTLPVSSSYKRVFKTSDSVRTYTGNLIVEANSLPGEQVSVTEGLKAADKICQYRASSRNLGGTWKAWLSDSNTSAASRLEHASVPYKLLNGTTIANNWADLTDGNLQAPVNITEFGVKSTDAGAWTNTLPDGERKYTQTKDTCDNWRTSQGCQLIDNKQQCPYNGSQGYDFNTNSGWTDAITLACSYSDSLYCFEQTSIPDIFCPPGQIYDGIKCIPVPQPSTIPSPTTVSGDGNSDGKVDLADLSALLSDFNKSGGVRTGIDLNGDGIINSFDFSLMRDLLIQKGIIKSN